MSDSLKKQAFKGVGWSAVEKLSIQGVQFVLQIILARLLLPSDYGIIAMLAIFIQISSVFIDSGFANALIQKQNCTERDYTTVFYYNLVVSLFVYVVLFFIAPLVAAFYEIDLLTSVMRVASLVVILNAFTIVQRTILVKQINFKSQTVVSFSSAVLSGLGGIALAYTGFGVWALCAQSLLNSFLQIFFFFYYVRWLPTLTFSKESFNELFGFGSKILVASIISTIYNNLYTIVIGKRFNSKELGHYSRAENFAFFPSSMIGSIISRVSYPVLSKIQNDDDKLKEAYRQIIRYSSFIIFPIMIGLSSLARPFIITILGARWEGCCQMLQILCFALMWDHLCSLNLNLLYVKGKTNLVLRLEIIKKLIAILILIVSIPFGIIVMCWGRVLNNLVAFYLNTYYTKTLVGLSFWQQLHDVLPYFVQSMVMGIMIFIVNTLMHDLYFAQLLLGTIVGILIYAALSLFFLRDMKTELLSILSNYKSIK